jgi:hypothetical protein
MEPGCRCLGKNLMEPSDYDDISLCKIALLVDTGLLAD